MSPLHTSEKRVAGVLLAAGGSLRFGQAKQLLEWDGKPLVAHVTDTALAAGLGPVIVVTGHQAQEVRAALGGRPVQTVTNWRWEEGLSTSVQLGLALLPPEVDGAIFLHCDQPLVTADLLRGLVARFAETGAPLAYPVCGEKRGTPVLFARALFPELARASGDEGGRSLVARHIAKAAQVVVADPDVLADMDTPEEYQRLRHRLQATRPTLASIRHLIVDMDGVLWRGEQPTPGLCDFFSFLHEHDIPFILATNNASKRPERYIERLAQWGVEVSPERILTSAQAAAAYLTTVAAPGTPVYVIGTEGLQHALTERGFTLTAEGAQYVLVGWAPDMDWQKLAIATRLIRGGAGFIGTNPDVTFPTEVGLVPGNGATLAALQAATGISPLVIGKPEPHLYREALRRMGATHATTAAVGDRLDTDIAGAKRMGMFTILVLSGISTPEELATSPLQPDLVCAHVGDLAQRWEEALRQ